MNKKNSKSSMAYIRDCKMDICNEACHLNEDGHMDDITTCECGITKKASKLTCDFCSFLQYIEGTKDTIPTNTCACGSPKQAGVLSCAVCDKTLRRYLDRRVKYEGLNRAWFKKYIIRKQGIGVAGKCSLCDGNYIFGGNNPQPVIDDYDARCCDKCQLEIIGPARVRHIKKYGRAY